MNLAYFHRRDAESAEKAQRTQNLFSSLRSLSVLCVSAVKLSLLLVTALAAPASTFYLTISGLGGEADYDQRFKMWADDIDSSLKKAGGDANVITLYLAHSRRRSAPTLPRSRGKCQAHR